MHKLHRITVLIFVLGLILGLGYWQQQGWAAGQAGNRLKQLFSSAAVSRAFSPAPGPASVPIPAALMATVTVTSTGDGAANAANCPGANCRLRDAIAKAMAGDTISFSVTGTINLISGQLDITKNLIIDGPGATQLTISGNSASRVFFITSGDMVEIRDLTIANGNSATTGGGISNSGTLTLTNCTLSTNRATNGGGGIYNQGGLTITGSTLSGNSSAAGSGGGLFTIAGVVNISNSTFYSNSANAGGGIANASTTVLTGSTLYDNSTTGNGGGIFNQATLGLTNTTLSGNDASSGSGGGIYGNSSASSILNNCTLYNNSAANGGGIEALSGLLQARNAIIAGNTATGSGQDIYGSLNSVGNNLIGNSSGVTIGGDPFSNILNVNPRLAPLANYGGPTLTHALLPGSSAIDEGDDCVAQSGGCLSTALVTDQRGTGFARKTGSAVDIGAFESRGFTLTLASGNNQTTAVNTAFTNPLSVNVTSSFGEPTSGGQVKFTPPVSGASATIASTPATISNGTATTGAVTANSSGGSYNVVASATGASTAINFALTNTITNTAPSFTPAAAISLQLGTSAAMALTVGTVADGQTSAGLLGVVQIVGGTATGITVTGIANTGGTITALISSSCLATSGTVRFLVSDGSLTNTGDLQVNLTANTGPALAYTTASVMIGSATTVGPAIGPVDNGSISTIALDSAGTYTGSMTVNNSTGVVSLSNAGPLGNHTITIRATDNCSVTTYTQFTVSVSATAPSYRVFSFGISGFGELSIPNEVRNGATAIATGAYHSLVVKDGRVYAYGYNLNGQTDVPVAAQSGVTAVAAAYNHSLALKNGGVIAWGELGSGIPAAAQSGVTAMAAGDFHGLFLKNGGVIGWGSNSQDQTTIPAAAQSGVTAIAAGDSHSLALKNGGVIGWGYNFEGQVTIPAAAQSGVTAIAAGERFSLAVKNGGVIGWGRNFYGELNIPAAAQSGVIAIAARAHHSLALKSTGEVIAWGQSAPTIPTFAQSGVVSMATGDFHHLVLKPTSPPAITAGTLTRQQATAGSVATVATVIDNQTSAGNLTVAATTVPAGITVTSITNTDGTITANVAASCVAAVGSNTVVLTVTDGDGETSTANLTVNVTANSRPTLAYGNVSVNSGASTTNSPTTATDNGSITGYAVQPSGTFTGTLSVNASGLVSIGSAAPAGNHNITIRATDDCGATTDATFTLMVNATATTTTITNAASLSATPTVVGEAYAVNVSVTAATGTPTGTVTVSDGSQSCTITLPATGCNLTSTSPSTAKTITATYHGSTNFGASSATAAHRVNKANTTTAITNAAALAAATVVGQSYSVAASVSVSSPGAGTLGGTISVSDGAANCTITLPATSCNLASTTAGAKTITATYNGDVNFNTSASTGTSHTVNKANTTTIITNEATLASTQTLVGQAVAINWSVTVNVPGALVAALTGNVTVSDGTQSCTAAVGAGTCNITFTTTGTKTLTAVYMGNTNYNGSTSAETTHTVNAAATTTTITNATSLSGTPTVVGQLYAVNVSVTAAAGTPTGTVTVGDGSQTCSITLPATSCNLTSASPGAPKAITATYNGDANFGTSSATASHTVNKAGTTTAITNAAALGTATVVGQAYSVAASVSVAAPGAGTPAGTITVSDGLQICTITLPATGCNLISTIAGAKTVTATYNGDVSFNGSASSGVPHTVNKANTTTTIINVAALAATPSVVGVAVAINWSVTVNSPGAVGAALTGNVTVSDGTQSCTAAVTAGTCSITFPTTGTKTLTAAYVGDANYSGSTSANATHTVNAAATTTTITNAAALGSTPTVAGQAYTVNVSVSATPPGTGTPTGTVTVSDGLQTCTVTLPASSCNLTSTTADAKTITATYNGDADFGTSSGTASHRVNKAGTTLSGLTDSPDPSVTGQAYTAGYTLNVTSPGAGTPTGTVTVSDGTGGSCTATLPATSCSLTSTTAGAKTLTFTYNGDANFNTSSNTAGHQVNKADTTTTITADNADPSVFGANVVVNFTVAAALPGGGTPTGNVVITVSGGAETCTGMVAAGTCTLALTALGNRTLTATYAGDTSYNGSSDTEAHTVNKTDTTTTIVSDNPDSSAVGQNVTVVFTVAATSPGAGTPTGNVLVTVSGGAETCTATVVAGSCVVALTTPGARTLTATYAGDANFNGSSDTESHSVVAPPAIAKAFAPASAPIGGTTTLTLTITNPASNTVALTGVSFTDTFPAGLVVATPLTFNNTCGGVLTNDSNGTLSAGNPGIKLSGGTVNASPGNSCTVSVNVTPTVAGPFNNLTGNVSSTNGGTGNTASATLLTNTAPTITSNTIAPQAGSGAASFTIATAVDPDQPVNILGITINGNPTTASSNGVTVSGVTITPSGAVTATVSTTCAATSASFTLVVTDNENVTGTSTLTVNVQPNQPPVLTYANQTITAGATPLFIPMAGPTDNGTITSLALQSIVPNSGLTLSLNPATGQIAVTSATLIGSYLVTVTATDNCGATATATLTVNVVCPAISLTPVNLPIAPVNTAYPQTLAASPAGGNYSFAVTGGSLPSGLTLNANGSFSGAPTQSGTFNFRVTATGFGGCTAFRDYSLVVTCLAITVTPASLPGGSVGTAYSQTVSATPAGSYSYSVSSGALPVGLMLNASSGAITGTPTATGSYTFTITASTGGGAGACSDSRTYTLAIGCSAITFSPASPLPAGQAGVAYSQTISVTPSGSYTLSLISGNLPSGMILNPATGSLSGTPTITGSFSFTIRALAGNGCEASQTYSLAVTCPTVVLGPGSLPEGSLSAAYNQTVAASPVGGNYTYAVSSGNLPPGLNLNQATGALSGTAAVSGAFSFRITATGFGGCAGFRDYTVMIGGGGGCPAITLADLPNGAPAQFYSGSVAASPSGSYTYVVTSGSVPPGLTLYGSVGLLYGYPTAAGTYNFAVTATDGNNCTGSKSYAVVISGAAVASLVFGDFDGDGKADLSVWRGQAGDWLTVNSKDGRLNTETWGTSAAPYYDVLAPGDYDGDGKMDLAVFRKSTGQWLIKGSKDGTVTARVWGLGTDIPAPGDYDGDGKTDIAVWRGADTNWYILRSSDGQTTTISWGSSRAPYRDLAVPADYDGDGKTDVAVFRQANGHWYIRLSSDGAVIDKAWGLGTDVPVAADYDGDGKADFAVWRGSDTNWYVLQSSDGAVQTISLGPSSLGSVPVPSDYDGDGKADAAIWQEATGMWHVKRSSDGTEVLKAHGQSGDVPSAAKRSN